MDRLNRHKQDPLSQLLRAIGVHSTVYCLTDFGAPWGFHVGDSAVAKFHLTLQGSAILELDQGQLLKLSPGELVVLPFGSGHTIRDQVRSSEEPSLESILEEHPPSHGRVSYGGRGKHTRLLCGGFALAEALPAQLLAILPTALALDAAGVDASGLDGLLGVLRTAAEDSAPGASAVFSKLADVFLTQALRSYLLVAKGEDPLRSGVLQQPAISAAIELMRNRLEERWTVASLAREVGLSRTLFESRFRGVIGQPPIRFLTRLRLTQAAGYLSTSDATIYAVARRSGYDTEASFSKAFKREFGLPPGAYRRASADRPIIVEMTPQAPA